MIRQTKEKDKEAVSLPGAHRSVEVDHSSVLRRALAFAGPGFLVSVGYMDPGNWATDLAGGSKFGYQLIWVILLSNLMAILLQTLCARMGLVIGKDLAQCCRDFYAKPVSIALWVLCEIAIIACDVAEVIGSAVALNMLFGLPLVIGVLITGFDVMILLGLMKFGFRKIEAIVFTLVSVIFISFVVNLLLAKPDWSAAALGLVKPTLPNTEALLIAVGILGATVMPHNLYLHSGIVQTRNVEAGVEHTKHAVKMATWDTIVSLGAAFFVNAAILALAAAVFHRNGHVVEDFSQAHQMLTPILGGTASMLFAIALLCAGQSSTITATLAGQIVMEGFLNLKVQPWLRRLITRGLAIIPAAILISGAGHEHSNQLLVMTQVVLSMQLPFAIVPLVMITGNKKRMGEFSTPIWMHIAAWMTCLVIIGLNIQLLIATVGGIFVFMALGLMVGFAMWVQFGYKQKHQGTAN